MPMTKPGPKPRAATISDQVRSAIRREASASAVARAAGVHVSVLLRFISGERGLTTDTLDKVAAALGLRLIETSRRRPGPSKSGGPKAGPGVNAEGTPQ